MCFLFPLPFKTVFMVGCTHLVGLLADGPTKKKANYEVTKFNFDVLSGAISLVCRYHNRVNLPLNGICVANHTSPVDALVLAVDNTYDLVSLVRYSLALYIFTRVK